MGKGHKIRSKKGKNTPINAPIQGPAAVCNDLEKVSFTNFLKCLINNDLEVLKISGNPSQNQLFLAWITILSAYYVTIGSKEQVRYIKMVAKMEAINLKINVVTALCVSLRQWYEPKLCECLKMWGYRLPFTDESFLKDIDRVLILLQNDNNKLATERCKYDNAQKANKGKGEAPTKDAYMKILYAIEKHRGQRYPPDKISGYEFALWYVEIIEYNEAQKREHDRINNKSYRNNGKQ